jgi:hypothetical protein
MAPEYGCTHAGFFVLTEVVMKRSFLCDITLCSPLKINRRFGGTYRLYILSRRISRERNSVKQIASKTLHVFISQKMEELFVSTHVTGQKLFML